MSAAKKLQTKLFGGGLGQKEKKESSEPVVGESSLVRPDLASH